MSGQELEDRRQHKEFSLVHVIVFQMRKGGVTIIQGQPLIQKLLEIKIIRPIKLQHIFQQNDTFPVIST